MEVKSKFKDTEIGRIPEHWEVRLLGDIASMASGGTPDSKNPSYYGGEILWASISDITKARKYLSSTEKRLTFRGLERSSAKIFDSHTVLFAMYASIGATAVATLPMATSQAILGIVCKPNIDREFLYYWLINNNSKIKALGQQGTQANLNKGMVQGFKIPLPSSNEQRDIASALSDTDELIAALEALIAKKQAIKLGTMQDLLTGRKRLPGFKGEWVEGTFADVATGFTSGATPYRGNSNYYHGNINWITSGELRYGVIFDTAEKITAEGMRAANLRLLPAGTFLIAITGLEAAGTRGSCGIVGQSSTTNQSCMAISPTEKIDLWFLFYYYTLMGDALAFEYCQGTKQQSYTASVVRNLPIRYPQDIDEQQAVCSVISAMGDEIYQLEDQLGKVQALKHGMMQELLTGRTRLG